MFLSSCDLLPRHGKASAPRNSRRCEDFSHLVDFTYVRCVGGSCLILQETDWCFLQQLLERVIGNRCPIPLESSSEEIFSCIPKFDDTDLERVILPNIEHWTSAAPCSVAMVYELERVAMLREAQFIPCHSRSIQWQLPLRCSKKHACKLEWQANCTPTASRLSDDTSYLSTNFDV